MAALHFTKFFLCIAYFHYAPFYTPLTFILSIFLRLFKKKAWKKNAILKILWKKKLIKKIYSHIV